MHVDRFSWQTKPSFSAAISSSSAGRLVAGTHRFFLASVAKYCSVLSTKMSPIMNYANDWIRMDFPRILQKEEVISCSCIMKGLTIIIIRQIIVMIIVRIFLTIMTLLHPWTSWYEFYRPRWSTLCNNVTFCNMKRRK